MCDVGVRVGTDIESVDDVRASLEQYGRRYLGRVFTAAEIASCGGVTPEAAPGLTARFAAKEAVMKLLQPVDVVPTWRSIEVRRLPGGAPEIALSDDAAALAAAAGITQIAISLSHGAGVGIATAVGTFRTTP